MTLRGVAALTASSAAIVLAGWVVCGGLGPDATDAMDAGGQTIAPKTIAPKTIAPKTAPNTVANIEPAVASEALPVAAAAIVDPSLLSPSPIVVVTTVPVQPARQPAALARTAFAPQPTIQPLALAYAEPVDRDVTAAIQAVSRPAEKSAAVSRPAGAPAGQEVRKAMVPKLDKDGLLTPAQIAQIKANLNLTPDQERYWAPVEAELKQLARLFAAQKAAGRKPTLSLDAADAQRLYWAAGPLIMSLREDQKREVRRLARAMGLEQVASLI